MINQRPIRPSIRQIQYFTAVADHLAFGKAADALAVSQPSLSKQLSVMEEELGVRLFERTAKRVMLTPAGKELLPIARKILQDVEHLGTVARKVSGPFGGKLKIGVLPTIGAYFMPHVRQRLYTIYPQLRLEMQEGPITHLLNLLKKGFVDVVIGSPIDDQDFVSQHLFNETLWVCAASDHPLSSATNPITVHDLSDTPLLSLNAEYSLTHIVNNLAVRAGTFVNQDYQGATLDSVRQMAVMGAGIAVLPSLYALEEAIRDPKLVVRRINDPDAIHEVALLWRQSSPLEPDCHILIDHLIAVKQEIRLARTEPFR